MTTQQLHDFIHANAEAKALADAGNDAGCAALISPSLPKVRRETRMSYLSIAAVLGPDPVRRLIHSVEGASANDVFLQKIKLRMEGNDGVDLAHPATRGMLDQFAALTENSTIPSGLTAADAAAIKALADQPQTVSADEVSAAWAVYRPEGRIS